VYREKRKVLRKVRRSSILGQNLNAIRSSIWEGESKSNKANPSA